MSVSSSGGSYAELLAERLRRAQTGEGPPESPGGPGSVGSAKEERTTLHESWLKKKRTGVFTSWQRRYFLLVLTRSDLASRGTSHSRCSLEYYGACVGFFVRMPDVDARRHPCAAHRRRRGSRCGIFPGDRPVGDRVAARLDTACRVAYGLCGGGGAAERAPNGAPDRTQRFRTLRARAARRAVSTGAMRPGDTECRRAAERAVPQHGVLVVGQGSRRDNTGSATQQPWHMRTYRRNGPSPARRASVILRGRSRGRGARRACPPLSFLPRRGLSRPAVHATHLHVLQSLVLSQVVETAAAWATRATRRQKPQGRGHVQGDHRAAPGRDVAGDGR